MRNYVFAGLAALLASTLLFSCNGQSDEDIQEDVQEELQNQPNISTSVKDGVVTLTGNCQGANCADSIVTKVKDIDGVKEVKNEVQQQDEETDLTLRTSVQSIISKYQGVEADVAGGVVVLRGVVERDQVQPLINELNNLQPKKIDNQLAIR